MLLGSRFFQPFRSVSHQHTYHMIYTGMIIEAHFFINTAAVVTNFVGASTRIPIPARWSSWSTPAAGVCVLFCFFVADVGRCVSRTARALAGATRRHRSGRDGLSGFPNGHCLCFLKPGRARRLQQVLVRT